MTKPSKKLLLGLLISIIMLAFLADKPKARIIASSIRENQERLNFSYDDRILSQIVERDLQGTDGDFAVVIESLNPEVKLGYYRNKDTLGRPLL
jgi:hypothetical protein